MSFFTHLLSDDLPLSNIIEFQYKFTEKPFARGNKLFKQGEPITHQYIVKSGEVEMRKVNSHEIYGQSEYGEAKGKMKFFKQTSDFKKDELVCFMFYVLFL